MKVLVLFIVGVCLSGCTPRITVNVVDDRVDPVKVNQAFLEIKEAFAQRDAAIDILTQQALKAKESREDVSKLMNHHPELWQYSPKKEQKDEDSKK